MKKRTEKRGNRVKQWAGLADVVLAVIFRQIDHV